VADFGPKTSLKIVDGIREQIKEGKLKSGEDIRVALKAGIVELLELPGEGRCRALHGA
jgi:fused signal recognition particle receptor